MTVRNLALIYSRKSVVRDPDHVISNERQEAACIRVAESHGWRLSRRAVSQAIRPLVRKADMRLLALGFLVLLVVRLSSCRCSGRLSPEHTRTPAVASEERIPAPSPTPLSNSPLSNCPHMPLGGFYDVWCNEQVWPRLGCAIAPAEAVTGTEAYLCDATHSLWLREKGLFVVIPVRRRAWAFAADESELPLDTPLMAEPAPRAEPCFPVSGRHGWLVHFFNPDSANELWARTGETSFSGAIQEFEGGWLFWNGNVCFVLFADGTWTMF